MIITCTTWLFKSMTERREPGVHSALMFTLKLVACRVLALLNDCVGYNLSLFLNAIFRAFYTD